MFAHWCGQVFRYNMWILWTQFSTSFELWNATSFSIYLSYLLISMTFKLWSSCNPSRQHTKTKDCSSMGWLQSFQLLAMNLYHRRVLNSFQSRSFPSKWWQQSSNLYPCQLGSQKLNWSGSDYRSWSFPLGDRTTNKIWQSPTVNLIS